MLVSEPIAAICGPVPVAEPVIVNPLTALAVLFTKRRVGLVDPFGPLSNAALEVLVWTIVLEKVAAAAVNVPVVVGDALSITFPVPVMEYSPRTPELLNKTLVLVPDAMVVVPTVRLELPAPIQLAHAPFS